MTDILKTAFTVLPGLVALGFAAFLHFRPTIRSRPRGKTLLPPQPTSSIFDGRYPQPTDREVQIFKVQTQLQQALRTAMEMDEPVLALLIADAIDETNTLKSNNYNR